MSLLPSVRLQVCSMSNNAKRNKQVIFFLVYHGTIYGGNDFIILILAWLVVKNTGFYKLHANCKTFSPTPIHSLELEVWYYAAYTVQNCGCFSLVLFSLALSTWIQQVHCFLSCGKLLISSILVLGFRLALANLQQPLICWSMLQFNTKRLYAHKMFFLVSLFQHLVACHSK